MILSLAPLLLLLPYPSVRAEPLHVNLAKRAPAKHDMAYFHGLAEGIRAKYGRPTTDVASRGIIKRANTAAIPILNLVCFVGFSVSILSDPLVERRFYLSRKYQCRHPVSFLLVLFCKIYFLFASVSKAVRPSASLHLSSEALSLYTELV
jgi:hypothetical protein